MKNIMVTKRNGDKESFNPDKIHRILFWATEGINHVAVSQIETKAQLQIYPGIYTEDIHEILIAAAHELVSEDFPNYQFVASRLRMFQLRKEALDQFEPWPLYDLIKRNIELKVYAPEILDFYTKEEIDKIDTFIDHSRDFDYTYAGIEQLHGKYLAQNRVEKKVFETPQYLNILVAMMGFHKYPDDTRLNYIKEFYDYLSKGEICLPTPVMAGLRTNVKQYSSCVLIECDDTLDSINATTSSIVNYVSQKAGIGLEGGHIRALGSPIRDGDTKHTGVTPFYRLFESAVLSCSQGGVRKGAATLYAPFWHLEIEQILNLKNNKGTEEDSVRGMDYGIQFNSFAYERLINNQDITLFSPHEVPDLHEAFFVDQQKFRYLYEKYERKHSIMKKKISARDLFTMYVIERKETGRIYLLNVDHANTHSSFIPEKAPIRMSNLCLEITLPTKPLQSLDQTGLEKRSIKVKTSDIDQFNKMKEQYKYGLPNKTGNGFLSDLYEFVKDGEQQVGGYFYMDEDILLDDAPEISLCTLSSYNLGKMKTKEDMERPLELIVRFLNELLDYQNYPVLAAKISTMNRRPIGVGITNLAYWLAKNGFKYSDDSAVEEWDEVMEAFQYYLIKASMLVAKERGCPAPKFNETKYYKGLMPIDTYKETVNDIVPHQERMDWDWLREQVKEYGMMNSTLSSGQPVETSSQVVNSTNGFEPVRSLISIKGSGEGRLKQVVPGFRQLKNKYELLWDQESCKGYLNLCAIAQKYFDQAISSNTSYNPKFYQDEEIPISEMIKDLVYCYRIGLKTLYYANTFDGMTDEIEEDNCLGGACKL